MARISAVPETPRYTAGAGLTERLRHLRRLKRWL